MQELSVSHRTSDAERLEPTVATGDPLHVDEVEDYGSSRCQIVAIWPEDPAQMRENWKSVIVDRCVTSVSHPFLRRRKSECDRRVMEASEGGSGAEEVGAFSSTECRDRGFLHCDRRLNGVSMPNRVLLGDIEFLE